MSGLGSTPWWGINKAYGVGPIVYKGSYADANYTLGTTLNVPWALVNNVLYNGRLPADVNAIYMILSSR